MKDYLTIAQTLYPLDDRDTEYDTDRVFPYWISSYQPIIDSFGTVALQVDDEDYQGDSRILYVDTGNGYGYLQFGWGSCSGCDALQACDTYGELAKLIEELDTSIKWLPAADMLKYFREHDWVGDYSWREEEQQKFVNVVISYLEEKEKSLTV